MGNTTRIGGTPRYQPALGGSPCPPASVAPAGGQPGPCPRAGPGRGRGQADRQARCHAGTPRAGLGLFGELVAALEPVTALLREQIEHANRRADMAEGRAERAEDQATKLRERLDAAEAQARNAEKAADQARRVSTSERQRMRSRSCGRPTRLGKRRGAGSGFEWRGRGSDEQEPCGGGPGKHRPCCVRARRRLGGGPLSASILGAG